MSRRPAMEADSRLLVGLRPVDPNDRVVPGAHLFAEGAERATQTDEGWITSACFSPHLDSHIGLGFLRDGAGRMGETIVAANPLEGSEARLTVVAPHFVDPEGGRLRD